MCHHLLTKAKDTRVDPKKWKFSACDTQTKKSPSIPVYLPSSSNFSQIRVPEFFDHVDHVCRFVIKTPICPPAAVENRKVHANTGKSISRQFSVGYRKNSSALRKKKRGGHFLTDRDALKGAEQKRPAPVPMIASRIRPFFKMLCRLKQIRFFHQQWSPQATTCM